MMTQNTEQHIEVTDITARMEDIRARLQQYGPMLERVLPHGMRLERFVTVVMAALRRNPTLLLCHPTSLLQAVMYGCQLGLEPGSPLGLLHIVPFKSRRIRQESGGRWAYEAVPIIGYQGLIELAYRSGMIEFIEANAVYERDEFDFQYGTNAFLHHKPYLKDDPGPLIAYYALAVHRSGLRQFRVVFQRDVERIKQASRAYVLELQLAEAEGRSPAGPWFDWEDRMGMKTAVKALAKWLPKNTELQRFQTAVAVDSEIEAGRIPALDAITGIEEPAEAERQETPAPPSPVERVKETVRRRVARSRTSAEPPAEPPAEPEASGERAEQRGEPQPEPPKPTESPAPRRLFDDIDQHR